MPTLNWIGKDKVINHDLDIPYHVLDKKYVFNATTSDNMIIHGDNLIALKSLLPKFEGKVDIVYIDPPYNTGNEGWIYNDNVNDPHIKKWLGQVVGPEGEDLSRHDKWLCMMYPRLKILSKLLSKTGCIFISIDENEFSNLRLIMDEIMGGRNYVGTFIKQSKVGGGSDSKYVVKEHEYLLIYGKNVDYLPDFFVEHDSDYLKRYKESDVNGRFFWDTFARPGLKHPIVYDIIAPDGTIINNGWIHSKERFEKELKEGIIRIIKSKNGWSVQFKQYLNNCGKKPRSMTMDFGGTIEGKNELKAIFGNDKIFPYPKSSTFIKKLLKIIDNKSAVVLDSFAGSGTTAQAVLELNKEDGGNRRFIEIEMLEYAEKITAERVRRVISSYSNVNGTNGNFSFYELGEELFVNGNINPNINDYDLRQYIYYTVAKEAIDVTANYKNKYLLGIKENTSYYFYYEKEEKCILDDSFLSTIDVKTDSYIIFADACTLSNEELSEYHITFKKTPRDITRF